MLLLEQLIDGNQEREAELANVRKVYSFAFRKGIYFNMLYEQLLKEEYSSENVLVLFHGSNSEISFPIDLDHSRSLNDFGKGFYLKPQHSSHHL